MSKSGVVGGKSLQTRTEPNFNAESLHLLPIGERADESSALAFSAQ